MADGTGNAELDTLLLTRHSHEETALRVVGERTAQRVTHVVAEGTDAVEPARVGLHGELVLRIGARAGTPSLTIYIYRGVDTVDGGAYVVHRLNVVYAHEVEAEAVDVILIYPVLHALLHELAHERFLRCRLVAAARAVAVLAIGCLAVEIVGPGFLEVGAVDVERVVVHNIENNPDANPVQGLHHLLELAYARLGVGGVGGIGTLGHVVVHGVVAPVVLRAVRARLVDRGVVERRQDVYGVDAQVPQIVDGGRLREGEKLALVADARREIHREVAVVKLVDNEVAGVLQHRTHVIGPSLGVGVAEVDDCAALAVDAHCLGKHAGSGVGLRMVVDAEHVVFVLEVVPHGEFPLAGTDALHRLYRLCGCIAVGIGEHNVHFLHAWRGYEVECCRLGRVLHFVERLRHGVMASAGGEKGEEKSSEIHHYILYYPWRRSPASAANTDVNVCIII